MRKRFGRNDIILISVIVIISVALLLIWKLVYLKGQDTDSDACVEVTIDGRAYGTYPLSKDDTIEIKNGDGDVTNTLVIKCGVADMTSADCPDHLCVKQKEISKEGESIICLPNKVVVTIKSGMKSDIDSISSIVAIVSDCLKKIPYWSYVEMIIFVAVIIWFSNMLRNAREKFVKF